MKAVQRLQTLPGNSFAFMKVVYFGTYRAEYSRNQIMIAGLRSAGVEVLECHEPLWRGIEDRVQAASGGWFNLPFLARLLRAYLKLLWRGLRLPEYDVLVCGYPGQFDVFLARLLTWLRGRPLVWDVFMSIYLVALERGLDQKGRRTASLLRTVERWALHLPDRLIQDTSEYVDWLTRTHGIASERFRLVPTGADNRIFRPLDSIPEAQPFTVLYYGTFIPNHGVPYIIEAARCLKDEPGMRFELVGEGPDQEACQQLARRYGLDFVTFLPWMPQDQIRQHMAMAAICLGAFGHTPQSLMTVQNKIYEGLAMGRPVVSGDSPAVRRALRHAQTIWLVDRDRPESLAEAIRILRADPALRRSLGAAGYEVFEREYSVERLGQAFRGHLDHEK